LSVNLLSVQHQITPPHITVIKTAEQFKGAVVVDFSQVLCRNEGTGMNVGQVNDVDGAGSSGWLPQPIWGLRIFGQQRPMVVFYPGRQFQRLEPTPVLRRRQCEPGQRP